MMFRCVSCSQVTDSALLAPTCERCGGAVLLEKPPRPAGSRGGFERLPPGVWRYRSLLPDLSAEEIVTLGEGGTPLLHAQRLGRELGLRNLMIKDESRNPTGSFMDRGATVFVSVARRDGVKGCSCDTTGNLGASLAAYCAKAGIRAHIRVNPNTDQGKLYQMLAYGAELEVAPRRARSIPSLEVTAANPYLLEGEKTTGYEIVQDLDWTMPDVVVVPVGTGGHLSMIWSSFREFKEGGLASNPDCRLIGVQLEDVTLPGRRVQPSAGFPLAELSESEPFFREEAARAIQESGGLSVRTTSGETISATGLLAKTEGIFAEPSAASAIAGLASAVQKGQIASSETVVCVITGAGLKDTRSVSRIAKETRRIGPSTSYASPSPKIGETKLAILHLLKRPSYAYEIWRILSRERRISTASVYQHLLELEDLLMVRKGGSLFYGGRERIMYELTRRGNDYLRITGRLERADRSSG